MTPTQTDRIIRTAVLSFWHVHAKDYAKQAQEHPLTELAAVWDEDAERGASEAASRGLRYYEHLDELLAADDIDAVIVTGPTANHLEIMTRAAAAGKHIFTEKVVALTSSECRQIVTAADRAKVVLTVSLPRVNMPFMQAARQLANSGLLGKLTSVRARLSHSGALPCEVSPLGYLPAHFFNREQAGGGALIDLGCHPMYIVRELLGLPKGVFALFGYATGKEVEDNAVVTLQYENGAIGIVEAGFVNRCSPFTLELHGTEGSAIYSAGNGSFIYRSATLPGDEARLWQSCELPPALPSAFEQWASHIISGTRADANIALALDLTSLMEAASRSARSGALTPVEH